MEAEKIYTLDEIKKIAPNYRGKPENFNPSKVGKKNPKPPPKPQTNRNGPKSPELAPPTHFSTKSSGQRNDLIIAESIYGVDVRVTEIAPRQSFAANYRKIIDIAEEVYDSYRVDQKQIERAIVREEVAYYAVGLLHLKLIEVKAKQADTALNGYEKDLRKVTAEDTYNVPQPISAYLSEIGTYCDKMGKETLLEIPPLPVTIAENFGGYHANIINADTHNLFEEIPSLGISGDMVMALASHEAEPTPNFHVELPPNSTTTTNLAGRYLPIGPRRPEIAQRLAGYGITSTTFAETIPHTRCFCYNFLLFQ